MIIMLVKDVLVNYQFVQDLLQCYPVLLSARRCDTLQPGRGGV